MIVIQFTYSNDPRPHRLVVPYAGGLAFEVCEKDRRGETMWKTTGNNAMLNVTDVLVKALVELTSMKPKTEFGGGDMFINLGKLYP